MNLAIAEVTAMLHRRVTPSLPKFTDREGTQWKEPIRQLVKANGTARGERYRVTARPPCGDRAIFQDRL